MWKVGITLTSLSALILMPALGLNPINAVTRNIDFHLFDIEGIGKPDKIEDTGSVKEQVIPVDYSKTGIIYPLFGLPGQTWDNMIEYRKAHPSLPWVAVLNPLNGPGTSPNFIFSTYVEEMQSANIEVLGYVSTYWAAVPLETIKDDIDRYQEWFNVDGIFLDEMSNTSEQVEHYREIAEYAKSIGMKYVIGNPGTGAAPDYIGIVDNIVVSEGYGEPTLSRLAGWHVPHGRENFSYIAYNRHTIDPQYVATSTNFASYLYITDDYMPNPYDKMPSHFDELLALLDPEATNDMRNVVVKSVDLVGSPVNATLTISKGSEVLASDSEWVTYVGSPGNTYQVSALDSHDYSFVHWEDGSTTSTRSVHIDSSSRVFTAYYSVRDAPIESGITVNAMTENGALLYMWLMIEYEGEIIESGFTPYRFSGDVGQQYDIHVGEWEYRIFDRWMDGSSANPYRLTYSGESFLTAYYRYDSPTGAHDTLTVNTYDNNGNIITMWITISIGDVLLDQGYTPLTVPVTRGETYTVSVADWEDAVFDRWNDGSSQRQINITIDDAHESISAYYRTTTSQH